MTRSCWTASTASEAVKQYQAGSTLTELGLRYGCDSSTVRNLLVARGIPRRRTGCKLEGESYVDAQGYCRVFCPEHRVSHKGYVKEHILVWEKANGQIPQNWHIHHINDNKLDNRPENLQAMPASEHLRNSVRARVTAGYDSSERVRTAKTGHKLFLKLYPQAVSVVAIRWFSDHNFVLNGKKVCVRATRPIGSRWRFDTSNRTAELYFLVLLHQDKSIKQAYLFRASDLPSGVWLGGRRGSRYESLALQKYLGPRGPKFGGRT